MTASTEEAAVTQALQIVGVERDAVSVEVLAQDAKGVTVRVSPRTAENAAPAPSPEKTAAPVSKPVSKPVATELADVEPADEAVEYSTPAQDEEESLQSEQRDAEAEQSPEAAPTVVPQVVFAEADDASKERAVNLAQEFLDRMGLEAEALLSSAPNSGEASDTPRIHLQIEGEDVGILIGKHGQTLQSFQYLLNVT
jgi:spoIIIJ-associated protein